MSLLNSQSLHDHNGYKTIRDWSDCDYWYVKATINNSLVIADDVITNPNITIVIATEFESYCNIIEQIYAELVSKLKISTDRILLISENADLTELIIETAKKYNTGNIRYEWSVVSELFMQQQTEKSLLLIKNIRPKTNISNKYFLNFNRRWRIHRPMLVALLSAYGLLDKGHISLATSVHYNWVNEIDNITKLLKNDEELFKLINFNVDKIKNMKSLYVDTNDLEINRIGLHHSDINPTFTDNLYRDTAFSVVSETYFFENTGRALTEKTFKPMAYHHPFILVAKPFSLNLLKKLGYKTFEPFINESYDREIDDVKRMGMILKEIKRLCKMDLTEIDEFLKNVSPITNHNFQQLTTSSSHIYKRL